MADCGTSSVLDQVPSQRTSRSRIPVWFGHFTWSFISWSIASCGVTYLVTSCGVTYLVTWFSKIWLVCICSLCFFSCDQAAIWLVQSVRLSVCPSVCLSVRPSVRLSVTPFSPCSHHRIIMKFSGVITMVKSDVHAKGQGQTSKVKVTEVNTQLNRFRTLTPVWIHIWQWNHAHRWKQHRRGALLFFKVIRQIWRSHGSKNRRIWPRFGVSGL